MVVKGKRYPRVFEVKLSGDSLNEGDVFLLDMGLKLYVWTGKDANMHEILKATEIAQNIKDHDRFNKAKIFRPQEDKVAEEEFWAALGGKPASIKPA